GGAGRGIPDTAVGDDAGGATSAGTQRKDVAERARPGVAARLDDDDLAFADGVEAPLLRVVAAAVVGEQVFAVRNEAQRARGADEFGARPQRSDAVDRHLVQATLAQLSGQPSGRRGLELGAQRGVEALRRQARRLAGAPCLLALPVVDLWQRP